MPFYTSLLSLIDLNKIHRMLELHVCLDVISLLYKDSYHNIIYNNGRVEITYISISNGILLL